MGSKPQGLSSQVCVRCIIVHMWPGTAACTLLHASIDNVGHGTQSNASMSVT